MGHPRTHVRSAPRGRATNWESCSAPANACPTPAGGRRQARQEQHMRTAQPAARSSRLYNTYGPVPTSSSALARATWRHLDRGLGRECAFAYFAHPSRLRACCHSAVAHACMFDVPELLLPSDLIIRRYIRTSYAYVGRSSLHFVAGLGHA